MGHPPVRREGRPRPGSGRWQRDNAHSVAERQRFGKFPWQICMSAAGVCQRCFLGPSGCHVDRSMKRISAQGKAIRKLLAQLLAHRFHGALQSQMMPAFRLCASRRPKPARWALKFMGVLSLKMGRSGRAMSAGTRSKWKSTGMPPSAAMSASRSSRGGGGGHRFVHRFRCNGLNHGVEPAAPAPAGSAVGVLWDGKRHPRRVPQPLFPLPLRCHTVRHGIRPRRSSRTHPWHSLPAAGSSLP